MSLSPFEAKGDSVSTSDPPLCTAIPTFVMQSVFIPKFFDEWDGCSRVHFEVNALSRAGHLTVHEHECSSILDLAVELLRTLKI
jgi:hypothetical protein